MLAPCGILGNEIYNSPYLIGNLPREFITILSLVTWLKKIENKYYKISFQ